MALIEKGADASIFSTKPREGGNVISIILVNIALLLFSIGIGIFLGAVLDRYVMVDNDVAYPASIFTVAGLGLFVGYLITTRIWEKNHSRLEKSR